MPHVETPNPESATLVWTSTTLQVTYAIIWIVYLVDSLQQSAASNFTTHVTSTFGRHWQTPTAHIMSQIVGGVFTLTLAKVLDVFGRPTGFLVSVVLATIGYVLMAAYHGIATYIAANVLCSVGLDGLGYCLTVFIADTSSLRS